MAYRGTALRKISKDFIGLMKIKFGLWDVAHYCAKEIFRLWTAIVLRCGLSSTSRGIPSKFPRGVWCVYGWVGGWMDVFPGPGYHAYDPIHNTRSVTVMTDYKLVCTRSDNPARTFTSEEGIKSNRFVFPNKGLPGTELSLQNCVRICQNAPLSTTVNHRPATEVANHFQRIWPSKNIRVVTVALRRRH